MGGAGFVARSAPDGYTLALVIPAHAANATLYAGRMQFDPLKDFTAMAVIGVAPLVLAASNKSPIRSVAELISYARTNPGKANYASSGVGSNAHLAMEQFMRATAISMQHVPGAQPLVQQAPKRSGKG